MNRVATQSEPKYCQEPGCMTDLKDSVHTAVDSKRYYWCKKHGFQAPEGAQLPVPKLLESEEVNVSDPTITYYVEAQCPYPDCKKDNDYDELEIGEHHLTCYSCGNKFIVNVED